MLPKKLCVVPPLIQYVTPRWIVVSTPTDPRPALSEESVTSLLTSPLTCRLRALRVEEGAAAAVVAATEGGATVKNKAPFFAHTSQATTIHLAKHTELHMEMKLLHMRCTKWQLT